MTFGCLLPAIQSGAADLRSDMLAAILEEDLRRRLRFKLSATYTPSVTASTLRGGTAMLQGVLDVEDARLPEALDQLRDWLDPLHPIPLTPAVVERDRRSRALQSAVRGASNGRVASLLFYAWNQGWPLSALLDDYPNNLAQVTLADLAADLQICRASAVVSVLGSQAPSPAAVGENPPSAGSAVPR